MKTTIYQANEEALQEAAAHLVAGELIAFPTETVYGLGADATNEQAVRMIYEAKGRPSDNPLIVHMDSKEQIAKYVEDIPQIAHKLIDAFMPGPFTIILKSNGKIAPTVTAGLNTVAIRIPNHPIARKFIETAKKPIAAPSANLSGKPSPTKAAHVIEDLQSRIKGIIDGGATGVGIESTVVDATGPLPVILRPGGITQEQIEAVVGQVANKKIIEKDQPKSPGMKYNHYEPEVPLYLIKGKVGFIQSRIDELTNEGKRVAVIASAELAEQVVAPQVYRCGSVTNLPEVATHLYDALRHFKQKDVDIILAESFTTEGIGQAIMNRLTKAATGEIKE
ncbi:L-threonylcarbamoyladenylate synthase [Gracilibacillus marinus]|uniref:Threonylcarbamoyl-AMP synthase n=1 Tax=Gracilibacillus marinus TaxID=630535 RepID=A0ABV8VRC1_9BACI